MGSPVRGQILLDEARGALARAQILERVLEGEVAAADDGVYMTGDLAGRDDAIGALGDEDVVARSAERGETRSAGRSSRPSRPVSGGRCASIAAATNRRRPCSCYDESEVANDRRTGAKRPRRKKLRRRRAPRRGTRRACRCRVMWARRQSRATNDGFRQSTERKDQPSGAEARERGKRGRLAPARGR